MVKWSKKYGPIFTVWMPKPSIVIADMELLKIALKDRAECFSGRPQSFLYGIFTGHKPNGDGIVLCQGEKWLAQRRFALKTFRNFGMGGNRMETLINFHTNRFMKQLADCIPPNRFATGVVLDIHYQLAFCLGNIINDLIMGRHYEYGDAEFAKFRELIDNTLKGVASFSMFFIDSYPWLRFICPRYYSYCRDGFEIQKFFLDEIDRHETTMDYNKEPENFIDAYLRDMMETGDENLSKLTLALNSGDLWTGGLETAVTTIYWGIIYLIHYPEIQRQLQQEIDLVLDTSPVSTAKRNEMPYMRATLDELQRLANILPWHIPHEVNEEVILAGFKIPKGTTIMPQIGAIFFDPEIFPDPNLFEPRRFLDQEGRYVRSEYLAPFGLGKRSCIGEGLAKMELFIIFTSLLQNFSFEAEDREHKPSLERNPGMTSVPTRFKCRIRRRRAELVTSEHESSKDQAE
uniref:Cytochrome P450 n=1 Tax=Acrobeloides nanus TaxID=290746 RepID=A0A914DUP9_9BILA